MVDICKTEHSVLYIACGTSGYMRLFNNIKRFVGVDFSKKMILASKRESKKYEISSEFHCSTFENFQTEEKFDVVWMGPYGHYVPFTLEVLIKARDYLRENGFVLYSTPDPMYKGRYGKFKEFVKCMLYKKTFKYDRVKNIESMMQKANLDKILKLRMKTTEGYSIFWIGKKTTDA
jgi:SAM-dependent methyltransferase